MSAIVGAFTRGRDPLPEVPAEDILGSMRARGGPHRSAWKDRSALIAVARNGWETSADCAGAAAVAADDRYVVASDASIYYRADLRRRLDAAGVTSQADEPAALILAAYKAWGEACTDYLEGDFAFIVWDRAEKTMFCARDFAGKRPIFYANVAGTLVVASTLGGVLAWPGCPDAIDLAAVGECVAGFFADADRTCYSAVRALPAGHSLARTSEGLVRTWRHWEPPRFESGSRVSFDAAAEELQTLIAASVAERSAGTGPTSIWLSGGWDSTAVFGIGQKVMRSAKAKPDLRPVSISYPVGDPGREDEIIEAVTSYWNVPVHWLDIKRIPLLDVPAERAAVRDEPFAHAFEMWNRALARGSRAVGARVALEGNGGDQLFQVSPVHLADLLRRGRLTTLAREWRTKGLEGSGFRNFFRWTVQPLLVPSMLRAARIIRRGRPLVGYLERPVPPWMAERFVRTHRLAERERDNTPARHGGSRSAYEARWYLTHGYFSRIFGVVAGLALEEGVEIRSPLYDRRVIELAATRPWWERASGAETKSLLRRSARGVLPDQVLAPRPHRTGTTGRYFATGMRSGGERLFAESFGAPLLAELGIVDPVALRRMANEYLLGGNSSWGVNLFLTMQCEMWLRSRMNVPARGEQRYRTRASLAVAG